MENRYVHNPLNEELTAIGGHCVITKEVRLPVNGREAFYTVGYGVMDTTCCGVGGCAYATVHGYITDWKGEKNDEGQWVSRMESITEPEFRKLIEAKIRESETVQQVNFL